MGEELGWNGLGAGYGLVTGTVLVLLLRRKLRAAAQSPQVVDEGITIPFRSATCIYPDTATTRAVSKVRKVGSYGTVRPVSVIFQPRSVRDELAPRDGRRTMTGH